MSDVLAAVLTREPEWTTLLAATPPRLRRLLERFGDRRSLDPIEAPRCE